MEFIGIFLKPYSGKDHRYRGCLSFHLSDSLGIGDVIAKLMSADRRGLFGDNVDIALDSLKMAHDENTFGYPTYVFEGIFE